MFNVFKSDLLTFANYKEGKPGLGSSMVVVSSFRMYIYYPGTKRNAGHPRVHTDPDVPQTPKPAIAHCIIRHVVDMQQYNNAIPVHSLQEIYGLGLTMIVVIVIDYHHHHHQHHQHCPYTHFAYHLSNHGSSPLCS